MGPFHRIAIALAAFAASAGSLGALDWPVDEPEVLSTFGTILGGRYLPGIDVETGSRIVRAVDDGELAFYSEGTDGPFRAMGAWVAVSHERNLVSVYAGLEAGAVPSYLSEIKKGNLLGKAAEAGKASRIRFMLFDREKSQWVNPLLFLDPVKDERAPQIRRVAVKRDALPVDLSKAQVLRQGLSEIWVDAGDFGQGKTGTAANAPFQVQVLLNGAERINLLWDVARESDGALVLFGGEGLSTADFIAQDGYLRIGAVPLVRGKTSLELIVSDFSRNSRTMDFLITAE
jgi:hypothetical protein